MISKMTFEKVAEVFEEHLVAQGRDGAAREVLLEFLGWDSVTRSGSLRTSRLFWHQRSFRGS